MERGRRCGLLRSRVGLLGRCHDGEAGVTAIVLDLAVDRQHRHLFAVGCTHPAPSPPPCRSQTLVFALWEQRVQLVSQRPEPRFEDSSKKCSGLEARRILINDPRKLERSSRGPRRPYHQQHRGHAARSHQQHRRMHVRAGRLPNFVGVDADLDAAHGLRRLCCARPIGLTS